MLDAAEPGCGEKDREQVMQASRREGGRNLKCVCRVDVHPLIEEAVAAHTVPTEAAHIVRYFEGGPAIDAGSLHPCRLARRVVGHLVLEEDVGAAISSPDHLVLLVMFNEKAVGSHVVTGDDDAGVSSVAGPTHTVAMIGPPCPDVIKDNVVAINNQAARRLTRLRAADTEEHIIQTR